MRYIDIINTELTLSGGEYIARMVLEGQLPAETEYEEIFVEWDLLIDADRSTATGWDWPLMCNDTGPDHLFRVYLLDDTYVGNYLNIGTGVWGNQQYQIDGNTVELYIPVSIGLPDEFEYTFAVRLYGSRGDPNDLLLADKAPDEGHYTFEATE